MKSLWRIGLAVGFLAIAGTASAVTQTFTFNDSTAPQAVDRMFRDGVPATCATPGTPALLGSASLYSYQTQSFFNNGPARCVTVTLSTVCTSFIGINAYSPTVSAGTRLGSTWLGDGGSSPNPSPSPGVTFSFNAPANAPVVFWVDRTLPVGSPGLANCDYTIQADLLDAGPGAASPVPTLSHLALGLLAMALVASAIYMTRAG